MPAHMIDLQDVQKIYAAGSQRVEALRGVSLQVENGEFVAIMGASGSGKSTLLHLCALLDRPTSGTVTIGGQNLSALSERQCVEFRRHRVGLIFQQFNLIPNLSVLDNVLLPARLAGRCDASCIRRATDLLDRLGLANRQHHRPDALSGGEQQRTAIARALIMSPPLLLADEPTGNLDSANSRQFWSLLGDMVAETSLTVLVVTHEPSAAAEADRVVVLRDGTVAGQFNVEEAENAGELAARYQLLTR